MANRFDILTSDIFQPTAQSTAVLPSEVSPIQKLLTEIATGEAQQRLVEKTLPKETAFLKTPEGQKAQEIAQMALGIGLTAPINVAADTALSRLISAIKSAKPIGKKIIAEQAAERAIRAGKAGAILEKVEGEKAFIQAKGQLKGQLVEKPRFEPLRAKPIFIPKELEPLAQEARKYKSAEEFVKTLRGKQFFEDVPTFAPGGIKFPAGVEIGGKKFRTQELINQFKKIGIETEDTKPGQVLTDFYNQTVRRAERIVEMGRGKIPVKVGDAERELASLLKKVGNLQDNAKEIVEERIRELTQAVRGVEKVGEKLSQGDIDTLFVQIQRHPNLTTFEKISAASGFNEITQGIIPQPSKLALLEDIFGSDLVKTTLSMRPLREKVKDIFTGVINIPRALMASFDMSAPLRQGVIFTTTKPFSASKATKQMFRQVFSEKNYVNWLDDIKKDPLYSVMKESRLYIADSTRIASGLVGKEERFMTNLAEKIPLLGKLVRAGERAYTSYLNKLRVDVFANIHNKFIKEGLNPTKDKELFESLASFINNATGRGDLGRLNRNAQTLNTIFFSPRLIVSRFNMLNPAWYIKQPTPVRKEAIKSFVEFVGIGTTVLTLAKLAGADVETDSRSTDFGKIRIGNTRWDIWGGFQQWARVISQLVSGERKTQKKEIIPLSAKKFPFETRLDITERFFKGKLAPVPRLVSELLEGQKLYGKEITAIDELKELGMPMYARDIGEAFEQIGPWGMLTVGVPAFFGVGVQTYEERRKENRFNF